jgi:hypothetical protein
VFSSGQATVGTATALVCPVPPGACNITLINVGTATAYVGAGGTAVTSTGGMPVPSGATFRFTRYPGSGGGSIIAAVAAGSATIGFFVSSAHGLGQTGTQ